MKDALLTLLTFLCGAGGLALINVFQERWRFKAERKAKKEDKAAEKEDKLDHLTNLVEGLVKRQDETDAQVDALRGAMRCTLLDRVIYLGQSYIAAGWVDFDDRKRLRDMHSSYHNGLGGNGDADAIMKAVDALPLRNHGKD